MGELSHNEMAERLEASRQFKVLRRLVPRPIISPPDGSETRTGLFVDVETTGLDSSNDEVIEIAMVPFTFGRDGRIFEVLRPLQQFREPSIQIPKEVSVLTGISEHTVKGHSLDLDAINAMIAGSDLVVAHHADFDRRFAEALVPAFKRKPWACSMSQVDWRSEGFESAKLEYLALKSGFFYERHRAMHDCFAGIELLASPLPSGKRAMTELLRNASKETTRFRVLGCPFALNGALRSRGYRFERDRVSGKGIWYSDLCRTTEAEERSFISTLGVQVEIEAINTTALERFSGRSAND